MAETTVGAFEAALIEALEDVADTHDVQIEDGWPDAFSPRMIIVGNVNGDEEQAEQRAGKPKREEAYTVEVFCRVEQQGSMYPITQAFDLRDVVSGVLRENGDVSGPDGAVRKAQIASWKLEKNTTTDRQGRIAFLVLYVRCNARI